MFEGFSPSGLLKIDIPQVDEEYEAFVSDYPYPEPFLSKTEESKDVKLKLETKDQGKEPVMISWPESIHWQA